MKVYLRFAGPEDKEDILRWRNDEQTRMNCFSTNIVTEQEHAQWYNESLENPDRCMLIAVDEAAKMLGIVRFDRKDDTAEIHIMVAPEVRGKGYGSSMISEACNVYAQNIGIKSITAKIKKCNPASLRVFEKAGFQIVNEMQDHITTRLEK